MNPKFYKYFGIVLIVLSILPILSKTISAFEKAQGEILIAIFFFLGMFIPGIYYYRFGRQKRRENNLTKSAIILHLIGTIALPFVLFFWPLTLLGFSIGSLLLLINWIKSRNKSSPVKTRKNANNSLKAFFLSNTRF